VVFIKYLSPTDKYAYTHDSTVHSVSHLSIITLTVAVALEKEESERVCFLECMNSADASAVREKHLHCQ